MVKEKHNEGWTQSMIKMQAEKITYFNGKPSEWKDWIESTEAIQGQTTFSQLMTRKRNFYYLLKVPPK